MAQTGQTINHYHANNGIFDDNGLINAINGKYKKLAFCGIGAHHQIGTIDNRNKILTKGARMPLLHGTIIWLQMIGEIFWPFFIKAVSKRQNSLQIILKGRTLEYISTILKWNIFQ